MGLLIFFFVVAIASSFLCSILEAVLLSITPSYVQAQLQKSTTTGKLMAEYKQDIDRPLSAILTLNTIAHTVGAIGVGAQAGAIFGSNEFDLGFMHLSYESIIATVMTLAVLILSEIIPKTIGANNWKSLAPFTVKALKVMIISLYPLVWLSQLITKTMKSDNSKSVLSRTDFATIARMGAKQGILDEGEHKIIDNLLNFSKTTASDIMTPKKVILMVQENTTLQQLDKDVPKLSYSRIPVFRETRDHITGIILKDDILENLADDHFELKAKEIIRPVKKVNANLPLPQLLRMLNREKSHLFIVQDDYGAVVGLVTMEDVIETLLGFEIIDETDTITDLQAYAKARSKNLD
jgi:CBS domain containing-hemolysin-like protein